MRSLARRYRDRTRRTNIYSTSQKYHCAPQQFIANHENHPKKKCCPCKPVSLSDYDTAVTEERAIGEAAIEGRCQNNQAE